MLENTAQLDQLRKELGKINSLIRAIRISKEDVDKVFVMNAEGTSGILMTRDELLEYNIEKIGGWREIDGFDVMISEKEEVIMCKTKEDGKWHIEGYDTFEGGPDAFYSLPGDFNTVCEAENAAKERLEELEKTQPSKSSGGQGMNGIQDRVYVVRPDGSKYRYFQQKLK